MKILPVIVIVLLTQSGLQAQKILASAVPTSVRSAVDKSYGEAKSLSWEKENENYEAEFQWKGAEYSAVYDAAGNLVETEVVIALIDLPASAVKYLGEHHSNEKIKEAAKITTAKGIVTFEAEVKGSDLIFDESGKFLREVVE